MKYYIKQDGTYIELQDSIPVSDTFTEILTQRPDDTYDWINNQWVKSERENQRNEKLRAEAYRLESDPIFFQWQRGTKTKQDWLDKVSEINQRYPK